LVFVSEIDQFQPPLLVIIGGDNILHFVQHNICKNAAEAKLVSTVISNSFDEVAKEYTTPAVQKENVCTYSSCALSLVMIIVGIILTVMGSRKYDHLQMPGIYLIFVGAMLLFTTPCIAVYLCNKSVTVMDVMYDSDLRKCLFEKINYTGPSDYVNRNQHLKFQRVIKE